MKKLAALCFTFTAALLVHVAPASAAPAVDSPAPDFTLTDANGKKHSLADFKGKYVVLEWTNAECPFVRKHYGSSNMQKLQKTATGKGAVWLAINSSAAGKEGYVSGDDAKKIASTNYAACTALLLDPEGTVGKLYAAKATPHMFLIDPKGTLLYAGAIDSIPSADQNDISKATNYVSIALDEAMAGKPVSNRATKAYGCSVKY